MVHDDADDTASFSVPAALRAPVGSRLGDHLVMHMAVAARLLLAGLALIVLDLTVEGTITVDLLPDVLGAVFVVAGVARVGRVVPAVGPAPARSRLWLLALAQLAVLAVISPPIELDARFAEAVTAAGLVQVAFGALGTAIAGTVLGRAHDALGQTARRNRWSTARTAGLLAAIVWLPLGLLSQRWGDPVGARAWAAGLASGLQLLVGGVSLALFARALLGTMNVRLPER